MLKARMEIRSILKTYYGVYQEIDCVIISVFIWWLWERLVLTSVYVDMLKAIKGIFSGVKLMPCCAMCIPSKLQDRNMHPHALMHARTHTFSFQLNLTAALS